MKSNKGSNGIQLINYLIDQQRNIGEEIYEEENKKMDPIKYLDQAKKMYKDYYIIS